MNTLFPARRGSQVLYTRYRPGMDEKSLIDFYIL